MGRLFITGDCHGSQYKIRYVIDQIDNPQTDDFIIIAGDAGFEYEECIMKWTKKEATKTPCKWIVLRGNHDSCYWKKHVKEGTNKPEDGWDIAYMNGGAFLYQNKYPNIFYLPDDGCIYNINGYNILFIPGAYSVDKYNRLRKNYPWNPNEQLDDISRQNLKQLVCQWFESGFDIDFIVSHTAPYRIQKYFVDLFLPGVNQSTVDNSMEYWLNDIHAICGDNIPWYFGHYHDDRNINDQFTMLFHDVIEIKE